MKVTYSVTMDLPNGVSTERGRLYVKDAVQKTCKVDEYDPMYNLETLKIKVETTCVHADSKEIK